MHLTSTASNRIANLGFLCVLSVVLGHVKWHTVGGTWTDFGHVAHSVSRAILPFFFAVSGFFLARHVGENGWWRKAVVCRIGSLGVPFVAWTLVYLLEMAVVDVALNLLAGHGATENLRGAWGSVRQFFGADPFVYPALAPLWYVRNLFLLVLASPALLWLVNRFRIGWLLALSAVHVAVLCAFCNGALSFGHGLGAVLTCCFSSEGLLYFSVGAYWAREDVRPPKGFVASPCVAVLAWGVAFALVLVPVACPAVTRHAYLAEGCSMPILAYAAWRTVSGKKWPAWIVASAFPMYLMHPVLLDIGYGVAKGVGADVCSASFCWVLFVSVVVGSVAVTAALRRFARPVAVFLFGGR